MTRPKENRRLESMGVRNGCPSQKIAFETRSGAKRATRQARNVGNHLTPYRCDDCGLWHNGHLPKRVVAGFANRNEHYGRTA